MNAVIVVLLAALCAVHSMPLQDVETEISKDEVSHKIQKRFVNLSLASGGFSSSSFTKIRAKRSSEEECEKLRLCRLHARSNSNFFAAFELYFVNKENARLWDHRAHSLSECSQRYSCYRIFRDICTVDMKRSVRVYFRI